MALISVSPFARQSKKQPFTLMKLSKHMLVECQFLRGRGVRDRNCGGNHIIVVGNDSNLLIVFYVQIMPDDFVMQLHR
ncbi:hypothetical protein N4696_05870, partial [Escherichia coli]